MPLAHSGFSVLSDAFEADPYRHFARLREQAPVHRGVIPLGSWNTGRTRSVF